MAHLEVYILKACGRKVGAGVEISTRAVGETNAGVVLQSAIAVAAVMPGGDAPGGIDDEVTMTLCLNVPRGSRISRSRCRMV